MPQVSSRPFRDRAHAGRLLAGHLQAYADRADVLVLALPRGGVPVASEVARALHAPMDVRLVRKLGVPGHEELAMGAVASGGLRIMNEEIVRSLGITDAVIERISAQEVVELDRRELLYRDQRLEPDPRGRVVILVDDYLATGSTMRVAARAIARQSPIPAHHLWLLTTFCFERFLGRRRLLFSFQAFNANNGHSDCRGRK